MLLLGQRFQPTSCMGWAFLEAPRLRPEPFTHLGRPSARRSRRTGPNGRVADENGRCLPTAWPSTRIPRVKEFYSHPAHLSESDIAYPRVVSQCKVGAKRPLKFLKCHECVLRFVEVRPKFIGSLFGSHESRTLMLGWIAPSPPRCRLWHDALYVIVRSPIRGHPRASWPRRRCARSVAYAG